MSHEYGLTDWERSLLARCRKGIRPQGNDEPAAILDFEDRGLVKREGPKWWLTTHGHQVLQGRVAPAPVAQEAANAPVTFTLPSASWSAPPERRVKRTASQVLLDAANALEDVALVVDPMLRGQLEESRQALLAEAARWRREVTDA